MQRMQETWVQSLGQEDPLESRKWQPVPVFLPGKFHGHRNLWVTVYGVAKNQTRLSEHTCTNEGKNHIGVCQLWYPESLKPLTVWITINGGKF